jgi:hypothetical protein
MKDKVKNRFKGLGKKIVVGVAKSVPFGDTVYRIATNVISLVKGGEGKKVDWMVVLIQLVCVGALVYAFAKGWIPVQELIDLLKGI